MKSAESVCHALSQREGVSIHYQSVDILKIFVVIAKLLKLVLKKKNIPAPFILSIPKALSETRRVNTIYYYYNNIQPTLAQ